ncbi:uncharacterized protein LOC9660497 [Selaginella moellendorffii]|nr:uncharacterized protein LOC9660497 [Selaginella moellendorffii]|eukprot:XP_002964946.2 uncharacterized protein LOC9660497 [Selaginella moellendorffii]
MSSAMAAIPVTARALGLRKNASSTPRQSITGDRFLRFPHIDRFALPARSSSDEDPPAPPQEASPADSQIEALEARLKSRRRKRRSDPAASSSARSDLPTREIKPWDQMSLGEKAYEVYVGEKGILFWLNKLAYASIFVIAGGWIVFRFVGPALGWYQLDKPLLPPDKLFSGSGDVKPPST